MKNKIDEERKRRTGEKIADVFQFTDPRHRIADAPGLEIRERQRGQMTKQPRAELDVDAVRGVREQIGAQDGQDRLEDRNRDQPDDQHVERRHAVVHEHFVDHDLEEQRRDQREQLQEERGDDDLAELMAIFVNGAEKPGDVEPPRQVDQAGPPGHQYDAAVAGLFELSLGHQVRARRTGRLDQDLVVARLAKQQKATVALGRDGRKRRRLQALPGDGAGARSESEFLGTAQHLLDADRRAAELMPDLVRIGPDVMETQQHDQGSKPGVRLRRPRIWLRPYGGGMFCHYRRKLLD